MDLKLMAWDKVALLALTALAVPSFTAWLYFSLFEELPVFTAGCQLGAVSGFLLGAPVIWAYTKSKESRLLALLAWAGIAVPKIMSAYPVIAAAGLPSALAGIACGIINSFAGVILLTYGLSRLFGRDAAKDKQPD